MDAEAFKMKAKADLANEDDSADPSTAEPDPTAAEADPVTPKSVPMSPGGVITQNEDPSHMWGAVSPAGAETDDPASPGDSFASSKPDADDLSDGGNTPRAELNMADPLTANALRLPKNLGASIACLCSSPLCSLLACSLATPTQVPSHNGARQSMY